MRGEEGHYSDDTFRLVLNERVTYSTPQKSFSGIWSFLNGELTFLMESLDQFEICAELRTDVTEGDLVTMGNFAVLWRGCAIQDVHNTAILKRRGAITSRIQLLLPLQGVALLDKSHPPEGLDGEYLNATKHLRSLTTEVPSSVLEPTSKVQESERFSRTSCRIRLKDPDEWEAFPHRNGATWRNRYTGESTQEPQNVRTYAPNYPGNTAKLILLHYKKSDSYAVMVWGLDDASSEIETEDKELAWEIFQELQGVGILCPDEIDNYFASYVNDGKASWR
jgi:hypothetical protein